MRQFDGEDSDSLGNTPVKDPFRFKLKVLKTEEASSSSPITGTRTCEFCGKEFVNGKALGGHIRIHNQAFRKNNSRATRSVDRLKEGSNLRPDRSNLMPDMDVGKDGVDVLPRFERSGIWDQEQICRLCNRTFPSVKSLFGHMRFHPERAYRGAQPLSSDSKTVSSKWEESDQETEATRGSDGGRYVLGRRDLLRDLPNWSRTDKRGRQSTTQAAHSLMSLSCMASRAESDDFSPGYYHQKYTTKPPPKKLKLDDVADVEAKRGKHDQVKVQAATITGRESGHKQSRSVEEFDPNAAEEANTDRAEIQPSQNQRRVRFQCSTCGRIFPTFQALGGHRSKHNKEKGTTGSASHNHQTRLNSSNPVLEASASTKITAAVAPASPPAPGATLSQANKDEVARIVQQCARLLEEGHALRAARKRCHSPMVELVSCEGSVHGDNTGQSSLGMKESSTGDQASQVGMRGMEIDLNKSPPAEDEDGPMSRLN